MLRMCDMELMTSGCTQATVTFLRCGSGYGLGVRMYVFRGGCDVQVQEKEALSAQPYLLFYERADAADQV